METIALPDQSALGRLAGYLKLARAFKHLKEFSYFREGDDARIGAALIHKAILLISSDLASDPTFFFDNHDIVAFFLQVVGRAESCQTGSYNDNSSILHDQ